MAGRPTEYYGRGGLIQREADGHTQLTTGEMAQLERAAGLKEKAGDRLKSGSGPEATFSGWSPELVRAEYDREGDEADR
jgi:hypothetical protein